MQNVLITGGAGFIGARLVDALAARGAAITVLDNLSPQIHGETGESPTFLAIRDKVRFIRADIRDRAALLAALPGIDAVVHLAAETGTGQSMYEIDRYVDVNVRGTAVLLEAISQSQPRVQRLVVASSRAVYGEGCYECATHGRVCPAERNTADLTAGHFDPRCPMCQEYVRAVPTTEDARLQPTSVYGITKLSQEQLSLTWGRSVGLPTIALRFQNVYGPGQSLSNPYTGILSIFSNRIRHGKDIEVFEDGLESRDFVFVDDVVQSIVAALTTHVEHGVFNVGTGAPTSVLEVARMLQEAYGVSSPLRVTGRFRSGDIRHNFADLTAARAALKYEPRLHFSEGLQRFVGWVLNQDLPVDRYSESLAELAARGLVTQ